MKADAKSTLPCSNQQNKNKTLSQAEARRTRLRVVYSHLESSAGLTLGQGDGRQPRREADLQRVWEGHQEDHEGPERQNEVAMPPASQL